jgi:hypothetical protein
MAYFTLKRIVIAAGVLVVLLFLLAGYDSWRVSGLEKKIAEQQLIVAVKETEAETHRTREAELEKAMAARDLLIEAQNVLIDTNTKQRAELADQVQSEQKQFEVDLAAGADLTVDELRDRICARFAAAKVQAIAYCGQ